MPNAQWPRVALAELAHLRLSSVDKKITPGERRVRLCNYSDVYNRSVLRADIDYMEATATEREIRNCQLFIGDVIITKDSETPDDIGVPAVVRDEIPDLICGYHLAIVRPIGSMLDSDYLLYALCASHAKRQFQKYANGITRFGLRSGDIARVSIPLPALPVQRKIAAILSSVDDAIEKTQAVIDQVQVVKRGLMQELLTRGLPGRHTRFKQTEIGMIPTDWRVVRIRQAGNVEAGRQRSPRARGNLHSYLRVANVYDGYIDTNSLLSMPFSDAEYARYRLVHGDLLLNEGQSKDLVGRCAQYLGDPDSCCFQNTLVRFRAGDRIAARFAFWVFRHYFYTGVFSKIARQTTSVAHLGVNRFANLRLALPSLSEQAAISENIETVETRESLERSRLDQLQIREDGAHVASSQWRAQGQPPTTRLRNCFQMTRTPRLACVR